MKRLTSIKLASAVALAFAAQSAQAITFIYGKVRCEVDEATASCSQDPRGISGKPMVENGLIPNGLLPNGILPNGLTVNGLSINGFGVGNGLGIGNGLGSLNGIHGNAISLNGLEGGNGVQGNGSAVNPFLGLSEKPLGVGAERDY